MSCLREFEINYRWELTGRHRSNVDYAALRTKCFWADRCCIFIWNVVFQLWKTSGQFLFEVFHCAALNLSVVFNKIFFIL